MKGCLRLKAGASAAEAKLTGGWRSERRAAGGEVEVALKVDGRGGGSS